MMIAFLIAALIAVVSAIMVITRLNAVSALLYMIISLLSLSLIFFMLGAPFMAALEVIIYAGAIMVLFIFVIMMLNLGEESVEEEKKLMNGKIWNGPVILSALLLIAVMYVIFQTNDTLMASTAIDPRQVGIALFGPYLIGVELAAFLIIAGIVGAYHLGKTKKQVLHRYLKNETE